jgi:hypothetical protein
VVSTVVAGAAPTGPSASRMAAVVNSFMVDAGFTLVAAFFSNTTRPVSRSRISMPTMAGANTSRLRIASMERVRRSGDFASDVRAGSPATPIRNAARRTARTAVLMILRPLP